LSWLIDVVVIPAFKQAQFAEGHDELSRGIVYELEHPDAGREELLNSAALHGEFAGAAPTLALSLRPARALTGPALLQPVMPTPFRALPVVVLLGSKVVQSDRTGWGGPHTT
jgi:hypothetical protein